MSSFLSGSKKWMSKELVGECMYFLFKNLYATPRGCPSNALGMIRRSGSGRVA